MKKLLTKIAILSLSALPLPVQEKDTGVKGYEIYEGEYISTLLLGDITHDYIGGKPGLYYNLAFFQNTEDNRFFFFTIHILDSGATETYFTFESIGSQDLIDWEASKLNKPQDKFYFISTPNIPIYFKIPLKAGGIFSQTKKYLATTSPAQSFAGGYDGFIPSFSYTSISGNEDYISKINSLTGLITGHVWQSGNVASLNIEEKGFILQNYYVSASVEESEQLYIVYLYAYAKSKDGQKTVDLIIKELGYVDLSDNTKRVGSYYFPAPVSTLETKLGYYSIIRSGGAYGLTDSVKNYEEGYKDGQNNPTFKTFIVSAFEACSAFFSLPVLGKNITIGTLIGSFVGLGALFLIIKLFR